MIALEQDEDVILEVRKHWFVLVSETFAFIVLALAPFFLLWASAFLKISSAINIAGNTALLILFAWATWYLVLWIGFFMRWTSFFLDVLVLTNKRVIYVNQIGLFSRRISTSRIDRIQDVTGEIHGLIPTFFNFGTITIQTAAEEEEFHIAGIPDPYSVKEEILESHRSVVTAPQKVTMTESSGV